MNGPRIEQWVPADGSDGTCYLDFDHNGIATITREAAHQLLREAGYVPAEEQP